MRQFLAPGQPHEPAVRAQVCVADYDLDGRLDLIVGDYCDVRELRPDLRKTDKVELERLLALERELMADPKKNKDKLADVTKKCLQFCTDKQVRRSHVWLYRRTGA